MTLVLIQCEFNGSDSSCSSCTKRGLDCGGAKSALQRRPLKAGPVDEIETSRIALDKVWLDIVHKIGLGRTENLWQEVFATRSKPSSDEQLEGWAPSHIQIDAVPMPGNFDGMISTPAEISSFAPGTVDPRCL